MLLPVFTIKYYLCRLLPLFNSVYQQFPKIFEMDTCSLHELCHGIWSVDFVCRIQKDKKAKSRSVVSKPHQLPACWPHPQFSHHHSKQGGLGWRHSAGWRTCCLLLWIGTRPAKEVWIGTRPAKEDDHIGAADLLMEKDQSQQEGGTWLLFCFIIISLLCCVHNSSTTDELE